MHVYDIEDAIDGGDLRSLQHALRVLLDYPQRATIDGTHLTGRLDHLFDGVVSSLQLDQTVLPPRLRETVQRIAGVTLAPTASYGEAATILFEFRGAWQAIYRGVAA